MMIGCGHQQQQALRSMLTGAAAGQPGQNLGCGQVQSLSGSAGDTQELKNHLRIQYMAVPVVSKPITDGITAGMAAVRHCFGILTCHLLLLHLQDNCGKFVSNMQQLQDSVSKYVAAIDQQVSPRVASCSACTTCA